MIKQLMELNEAYDEELIAKVTDHIKGRMKGGESLDIETAIDDFLETNRVKLTKEVLQQLNQDVREYLYTYRNLYHGGY